MKLLFITLSFLCWSTFAIGCTNMPSDTLIPLPYNGFRVEVSDLFIYQQKKDWVRVGLRITNTGSESLSISPKNPLAILQVKFDSTLNELNLYPFAERIAQKIRVEKINLEPGQQSGVEYVKFTTKPILETTKKEEQPVKEIAAKELKTEEGVENEAPIEAETVTNDIVETEEPVSKIKKKKDTEIGFETITKDTSNVEIAAVLEEKEKCPDLIVQDIRIVKKNKRWLILEYTVYNQGKGAAYLFGEKKHERDNLSVKAYMSGTPNLTRGSILLEGHFISGGAGILEPGQGFVNTFKLDIRAKTRYTPVIIVTLDSYQAFRECDRTNNNNSILVP